MSLFANSRVNIEEHRYSMLIGENSPSISQNGMNGYVRFHDTENPWFYQTINLKGADGNKYHFNRGSLIDFLNIELIKQGRSKDCLDKGNFLSRIFSYFQGSSNEHISKIYNQIIGPFDSSFEDAVNEANVAAEEYKRMIGLFSS